MTIKYNDFYIVYQHAKNKRRLRFWFRGSKEHWNLITNLVWKICINTMAYLTYISCYIYYKKNLSSLCVWIIDITQHWISINKHPMRSNIRLWYSVKNVTLLHWKNIIPFIHFRLPHASIKAYRFMLVTNQTVISLRWSEGSFTASLFALIFSHFLITI